MWGGGWGGRAGRRRRGEFVILCSKVSNTFNGRFSFIHSFVSCLLTRRGRVVLGGEGVGGG